MNPWSTASRKRKQPVWFYILLLFVSAAFSSSVRAEKEVIACEMFEGVKELNSQNPGNLGVWEMGAWQCRPFGPQLAGTEAPGWSGDNQGIMTKTRWDLSLAPYSSARANGMIGCWVRFEGLAGAGYYNSPNQANPALVLQLHARLDNAPIQTVGVTSSKLFVSRSEGSNWTATPSVQEKTWYWVQIEWSTKDSILTAIASYQPLGGQRVELSSHTLNQPDHQTTNAYVMNAPEYIQPGQHYMWRGRLGGVVLASISAMGEGQQMPDVLPPVEERHTWYLNPSTGNDDHNGLSPDQAWHSVAKLNQESAHSGMLSPLHNGYSQGDVLIIDTSDQPLDLGGEMLQVRTQGLTIRPPAGQEVIRIRAHKDISAPSTVWTQAGGGAHGDVWKTTDGGSTDLQDVVIWEDNLWLHHPVGSSVADVMEKLAATPGSFFSDGDTLYLHPFGSTDPNTDGKSYTRSRFRAGGGSAVMLLAPDLCIRGLDVRKTALARSVDNDAYTSYGIQGEQGFGGTTLLQNCYVDYAGKHCIGFTDSNSGRDVTVDSCQVEQGTPYSNQTPWVDYNGITEASGNRTTYLNCINYRPGGKIGSTEGVATENVSYYAHNNGIGVQFDCIRFIGGVYGGQIASGAGIRKMVFERAMIGGGNVFADKVSVTRCVMTQLPMGNGAENGLLIARHNIGLFYGGVFNGSFNTALRGKVVYEGNTFDLRPFVKSDNTHFSLFRRVGELDLVFRNNIFISPSDKDFNVIEQARDTDSLSFSNNLYQLGQAQTVVSSFREGVSSQFKSLALWQALGYDTRSQAVTDTRLKVDFIPERDSPAIEAGIDIGSLPDFSGRQFDRRSTIGAYEPSETFAEWRTRWFTEEKLNDENISGPDADNDNDGYTNFFEFALGRSPKVAETSPPWIIRNETLHEQQVLVMEVRRPLFVEGIAWTTEVSTDMIEWEMPAHLQLESYRDPWLAGWETIRSAMPLAPETGGRRFMRFVLSQTEE